MGRGEEGGACEEVEEEENVPDVDATVARAGAAQMSTLSRNITI